MTVIVRLPDLEVTPSSAEVTQSLYDGHLYGFVENAVIVRMIANRLLKFSVDVAVDTFSDTEDNIPTNVAELESIVWGKATDIAIDAVSDALEQLKKSLIAYVTNSKLVLSEAHFVNKPSQETELTKIIGSLQLSNGE